MTYLKALFLVMVIFLISPANQAYSADQPTYYIALSADITGNTKEAGTALIRGIELALEKVNTNNSDFTLEYKIFDHRGNPRRGVQNIQDIAGNPKILAILGGVQTPVVLEQLASIHEHKIPFISAWAAGTPIVDNQYKPNYVFRLSVRDQNAAPFFIDQIKERGYTNITLFLERTGWGRSNHKALTEAAAQNGITIDSINWFFWGEEEADFTQKFEDINYKDNLNSPIVLVANFAEGVKFTKALAEYETADKPTVISHWGISSGDFAQATEGYLDALNFHFLQTWSFHEPRAKAFKDKYCTRYGPCMSADSFPGPVGTAHAYDIVNIIAAALKSSDQPSRENLWQSLQNVQSHQGLVKTYAPPFSKDKHEALDQGDFGLYAYDPEGYIIKVSN